MDVRAAARALNQKSAEAKAYHFCDPTLAFTDSSHKRFLSLWRGKAGTRIMPARSELTPRDLKDFLPDIILAHRVGPSQYLCRVVGSRVTEVVGPLTGKTIAESAPSELAARWTECADLILDGRQPLRFLGRVHLKGREYLDAENLFVPLADDEGHPAFVMGLCRYTPRLSQNDES